MKNTKQLLIAVALASMSLNAMADITISGVTKVNANGGDYSIESDLTVTGKSGDTSVVTQIGVDNSNTVEQLYMTSKVAGINIKAGQWKSGKGELGHHRIHRGVETQRIKASTLFGGVKLTYEDWSGNDGTKIAVSGKIAGFETMLKKHPSKTEVKLSGSIGSIDIDTHLKDYDNGDLDSSVTLKTSVQGVDFTYVNTESDAGTSMQGFIGRDPFGGITNADAFGISTNILGNKVTYKDTYINATGSKSLTITRKIASGATFEATYRDVADGTSHYEGRQGLDLELAVKF